MTYKTHQMTALGVTAGLLNLGFEPTRLFSESFKPLLDQYLKLGQSYPIFTLEILPFFILALVSFGALLPDLDHKDSYISKRLRPISFFVSFLTHRGPTHRVDYNIIFFGGISFGLFMTNYLLASYIVFWLGIGSLLHIYGDMHTKSGVKIFGGKKGLHVLPKSLTFRTASGTENFWLFVYFVIFICFMLNLYGMLNFETIYNSIISNFK